MVFFYKVCRYLTLFWQSLKLRMLLDFVVTLYCDNGTVYFRVEFICGVHCVVEAIL